LRWLRTVWGIGNSVLGENLAKLTTKKRKGKGSCSLTSLAGCWMSWKARGGVGSREKKQPKSIEELSDLDPARTLESKSRNLRRG